MRSIDILRRRRRAVAIALAIAGARSVAGQNLLFSTDFDTDTSASWNIVSSGDGSAAFGLDYSALGVPASPGSASTRGLLLQAHLLPTELAHAITVSPKNASFNANSGGGYRVEFDAWANSAGPFAGGTIPVGGATGRTQYLTAGVGYDGVTNNFAGNTAVNGATPETGSGAWFTASGDGFAIRDFRAFKNGVEQTNSYSPNPYAATTTSGEANYYERAFPSVNVGQVNGGSLTALQGSNQTGTTVDGSIGFAWHHWSIDVSGNSAVWWLDGLPIARLVNGENGDFTPSGNLSLGYMDIFSSPSSIPQQQFALLDNLQVRSIATPANANWLAGAGSFDNAAKWSTGRAPDVLDDVTFDVSPVTEFVVQSMGSKRIARLLVGNSHPTLDLGGGTIAVDNADTGRLRMALSTGDAANLMVTNGTLCAGVAIVADANNSSASLTIGSGGGVRLATSSSAALRWGVGSASFGTVNVVNAGKLIVSGASGNTNISLGFASTGVGTLLISGPGALVDAQGTVLVADQGVGLMRVENQATLNCGSIAVGANGAAAVGTAILTNATVNAFSGLSVGRTGSGTMLVTNATHVSTGLLRVGESAGGAGFLQIDGPGTSLALTQESHVGSSSNGTLLISQGGRLNVNGGFFRLAFNAGSNGTLLFNGTGSSGTFASDINAGYRGAGTLSIDGGSINVTGSVFVADQSGSRGVVNVANAGQLNVVGNVFVGNFGTATVTLASATALCNTLTIASLAGSKGTLNVSGATSRWSVADQFNIGSSGAGTMTMSAGTIAANTVNLGVGTTGTGAATISGGRLSAAFGIAVGGRVATAGGAGTLTFTPASSFNAGFVRVFPAGLLTIKGAANSIGTLDIAGGIVRATAGSNTTVRANALSMNAVSLLDLNDNAMVIDYTGASPISTIRNLLVTGRGTGIWNGVGITSSSAQAVAINGANPHKTGLGYAEASSLGINTFAGQPLDNSAVLVRYAYLGDANLDGRVNAMDFNAVAINFGTGALWVQGDFNYDNIVNAQDFTALAGNFNQVLAAPALGTLVPETNLLLGALLLMSGVRHRSRGGSLPAIPH